ncbi:alpha-ketoglutarate-dependent dioxygenase AlkB [Psychrobacter sp. TAE2020]|uniref:alpha-ketoglutarate-dependent dioxygenase AlkB family protein n=1 Tax=Psychrobacter sp. TAE2020 TaxID=2846762 RepID=UPI001C11EA30|nr:alpha-ketoglutarate-dependent dioxygenase AlkB [Psychrobacter sp. TAE2020]MBU5617029.1 alpha-ketoglutarate-dependent dioxygenase AlkB [Psychrobacter sp. TAE2020]
MNDLFGNDAIDNLLPYDGQLYDLGSPALDTIAASDKQLYQQLLTTLPWQSDIVTLFGNTHITKRQIVWMGDQGLSYRYAGHTHNAHDWHPIVFHVKQIVEDNISDLLVNSDFGAAINNYSAVNDTDRKTNNKQQCSYFNACLLNYYPSGSEGMGYHADDEKELGEQPLIAALSLGATRKMLFRHKTVRASSSSDKLDLYLNSGQLIVMAGVTQQYWKHSIAKTTTVNEGRISLTFRRMINI